MFHGISPWLGNNPTLLETVGESIKMGETAINEEEEKEQEEEKEEKEEDNSNHDANDGSDCSNADCKDPYRDHILQHKEDGSNLPQQSGAAAAVLRRWALAESIGGTVNLTVQKYLRQIKNISKKQARCFTTTTTSTVTSDNF